ncbi:putative coenzyme A synthetase [Ilyonectria robusta]|uniref:putative coenzyme A synthetase n=1 Tax=Ilyonectria robusta TaxID=1079257 RepID=UPI001E8E0935|nr:putative coenzyme A synthetase [Ilyonectria robusta]KAH8734520.1 putative coenzyme A synthetase [Ilyonectria robusta]
MDSNSVLVEHPASGIVRIILNRPKALNALNVDLLDSLVRALRENAQARIIVLEGAGERSFCAGEDLKQTLAPVTGTPQELREAFHKLQDLTRLTSSSQAVVIAVVQGFAIGGGAELALAADFVIGGPAAKFRFPEVPIGHAATGGITLRLTHLVGLLKAKDLLLTGRWIESSEALKIGLLSEISEDPKRRALELAVEMAKLPAISLASSKTSLERAVFTNMEACLQDEINVASYCFAQSDATKAFSDFAARKTRQSGKNTGKPPVRDINAALKRVVDSFPDRTFLRFGGRDITFGEFDVAMRKLAGGLKRAGIQPGDRVLVMMANSVEMVYSWMATNQLGAVWVPVNTELKSVTLKHVIQAAQPKLAIVDVALWPELKSLNVLEDSSVYVHGQCDGLAANFSTLLQSSIAVGDSAKVTPATTSAFLYTSGTTGRSKPCVLSHEYFILQAQALIESCGLRADDVLFCSFPLFHADATALTIIPAILLGAVAALSVRFTATRFWDEIRAAKATVYDFMGATLALTYKQPPSDRDRDHSVRLAWGVPIPQFGEAYEERFGHPLTTLYGSVEASLPIIQDRSRKLPVGSCGRLREGHQLRIANDMDEELPPNTPGHLLLRSDVPNAFFQGYFNDPENTAAASRGLWLHTGDIAKVDDEGNVYFIGRVKDVVRRRGENVNAAEVEEEFLQHPEVVIAAAYGVPSQLGSGTEEDVKVAVQMRAGSTIDEKGLWEWAVQHMARFQVPSVIEFVDEIKKTPTGKMEKGGLKTEGGQRFDIRDLKKVA